MNTIIKNVESHLEKINQFCEISIDVQKSNESYGKELTFKVSPQRYNILFEPVVSALVAICQQFRFNFYISFNSEINKPQFVMYFIYDVPTD